MEGLLYKRGGLFKTWHKRYFRLNLNSGVVSYFFPADNPELSNILKGSFSARGGEIEYPRSADHGGRKHLFGITPRGKSRMYVLQAPSKSALIAWVGALKRAGATGDDPFDLTASLAAAPDSAVNDKAHAGAAPHNEAKLGAPTASGAPMPDAMGTDEDEAKKTRLRRLSSLRTHDDSTPGAGGYGVYTEAEAPNTAAAPLPADVVSTPPNEEDGDEDDAAEYGAYVPLTAATPAQLKVQQFAASAAEQKQAKTGNEESTDRKAAYGAYEDVDNEYIPTQQQGTTPSPKPRNVNVALEKETQAMAHLQKALQSVVDHAFSSIDVPEESEAARYARLQETIKALGMGSKINFNDKYQELYDRPCATPKQELSRASELQHLLNMFVTHTKEVAEVLVEQELLPPDKQIIPSADVGGRAGGQKFIFGNVLYKYARDVHGIYKSEEYAQKAAALEIRALNAVVRADVRNLHTTLAVLIRLHGRGIYATVLAPLHGQTSLVYGSCDAGRTIEDGSRLGPVLLPLMDRLGQRLHIRKHGVLEKSTGTVKHMVFPVDGEIHAGDDGRLYVLDLARLFPPTPHWSAIPARYHFLAWHFRPELLVHAQTHGLEAASPDVLSNFGNPAAASDEFKRAHHLMVFLVEKRLPQLWTHLVGLPLEELRVVLVNPADVAHKHGVNVRYLPQLLLRAVRELQTGDAAAGLAPADDEAKDVEEDASKTRLLQLLVGGLTSHLTARLLKRAVRSWWLHGSMGKKFGKQMVGLSTDQILRTVGSLADPSDGRDDSKAPEDELSPPEADLLEGLRELARCTYGPVVADRIQRGTMWSSHVEQYLKPALGFSTTLSMMSKRELQPAGSSTNADDKAPSADDEEETEVTNVKLEPHVKALRAPVPTDIEQSSQRFQEDIATRRRLCGEDTLTVIPSLLALLHLHASWAGGDPEKAQADGEAVLKELYRLEEQYHAARKKGSIPADLEQPILRLHLEIAEFWESLGVLSEQMKALCKSHQLLSTLLRDADSEVQFFFNRSVQLTPQELTADNVQRYDLLRMARSVLSQTLSKLIQCHEAANELKEAAMFLQEYEALHDQDEPTLWMLKAKLLARSGNADKAVELLKTQFDKCDPSHHGNRMSIAYIIGSTLFDTEQWAAALPWFETAVQMSVVVSGPDHAHTLVLRDTMATIYKRLGQLDKAEALVEDILAAKRKVLVAAHPEIAQSLCTRAGIEQTKGRIPQAINLTRQAVKIFMASLGAEHPRTIENVNTLLMLLIRDKNNDHLEAISIARRNVQAAERAGLKTQQVYVGALNCHAQFLLALNRPSDAIPILQRAMAQVKDTSWAIPKAVTAANLATALFDARRYREALPFFKRAVGIYQRVKGAKSPETVTVQLALARNHGFMGQHDTACRHLKEIVQWTIEIFGEEHPITRQAMRELLRARKVVTEQYMAKQKQEVKGVMFKKGGLIFTEWQKREFALPAGLDILMYWDGAKLKGEIPVKGSVVVPLPFSAYQRKGCFSLTTAPKGGKAGREYVLQAGAGDEKDRYVWIQALVAAGARMGGDALSDELLEFVDLAEKKVLDHEILHNKERMSNIVKLQVNPWAIYDEGLELVKEEKYDEALALFDSQAEEAMQNKLKLGASWMLRGQAAVYAAQGDYHHALELAEHCVDYCYRNDAELLAAIHLPTVCEYLAAVGNKAGIVPRLLEALEIVRKQLKTTKNEEDEANLRPTFFRVVTRLFELYYESGNTEQALAMILFKLEAALGELGRLDKRAATIQRELDENKAKDHAEKARTTQWLAQIRTQMSACRHVASESTIVAGSILRKFGDEQGFIACFNDVCKMAMPDDKVYVDATRSLAEWQMEHVDPRAAATCQRLLDEMEAKAGRNNKWLEVALSAAKIYGCFHRHEEALAVLSNVKEAVVSMLQDVDNSAENSGMQTVQQQIDQQHAALQEWKKAQDDLQARAKKDDPDALLALAVARRDGMGQPSSVEEAVDLFTRAAKLQHVEAMYQLGCLLADGVTQAGGTASMLRRPEDENKEELADTRRRAEEAAQWWRRAADASPPHAEAAYRLALYHQQCTPPDHTTAVKYLRVAVKLKHVGASYVLGECLLLDSKGVSRDTAKGAQLIHEAAEQGYLDAEARWGRLLKFGSFGVPKDAVTGLQWLKKAAKKGHTTARFSLSDSYRFGLGTDKDVEMAFAWAWLAARDAHPASAQRVYKYCAIGLETMPRVESRARVWLAVAAFAGDPNGQHSLGKCFQYGWYGEPVDLVKAFKWYSAADASGNKESASKLAIAYEDGLGVAKNPAKALEYYQKGADSGDKKSTYLLALSYYEGDGVKQDFMAALRFLTMAHKLGHSGAPYYIAEIHRYGKGNVVPKSLNKAFKFYLVGAQRGDADCMFKAAYFYRNGMGVATNLPKAVHWYEKCISAGQDAQARFNLALLYRNGGNGIAKKPKRAQELYLEAANLGHKDGINSVSIQSKTGSDVFPKNLTMALKWARKGAEQHQDLRCVTRLGIFYENGLGVKQDYQLAVKYYTQASQGGYCYGSYNMALMHDKGLGVPKNVQKSKQFLLKARKQGYDMSKASARMRQLIGA